MGLSAWTESRMQRFGISAKKRRITVHYMVLLGEQLAAMLPLSLLQVAVLAIFFHKTAAEPALAAAGLLAAVFGLVLFLDGLRLSIMPMAMQVGRHLPEKVPLPIVLVIAFALGVLVTYAEPAIAAIRPLAALVDPQSAPYLYYVLNQQQEITVLSIGLGVGLAAVLGMLKFMYNLPLKALIAGSLLPTIAAACWMQWGNPHLQPILGVAWDCGAVTTGPVTVPILIALGVSVMKAQRQKQQALAAVEEAAVNKCEGNTLEGFGIVTLASLLPILAVEVMAIIISLTHTYDQVMREVSEAAALASTRTEPLVNRSPVREVIFAVRAIAPLCIALLLLVVVVLRIPLPVSHFDVHSDSQEEQSSEDNKRSQQQQQQQFQQQQTPQGPAVPCKQVRASSELCCEDIQDAEQLAVEGPTRSTDALSTILLLDSQHHAATSKQAAPAAARELQPVCFEAGGLIGVAKSNSVQAPDAAGHVVDTAGIEVAEQHGPAAANSSSATRAEKGCWVWVREHSALLWGMLMCQVGMVLFNLGLTYGFTALGDMTGTWLPTSFMQLPYAPGSPYYSVAGGVVLTLVTIFLLGVLATNAEPALNVLGQTVESLSAGQFTKRLLIWAVSIGVAVGMDVGACKILFSLPLIYFILAKYAAASVLTMFTKEKYTAVAWDSAGVTTGPVTVPFVLAIGLAFGKAVGAPEGFGMLTVMSVAPIISVLITSLLRKPVQRATSELFRVSTTIAAYSLERFSRRGDLSSTSLSLWGTSASIGGQQLSSLPRDNAPRGERSLNRSISAPAVRVR